MLAIKVYLNDEYLVTAGQKDWSVLAAHVNLLRRTEETSSEGSARYSIGGLSQINAEGYGQHFRWSERSLKVGDKIHFEIVETNDISEPIKRFRSDKFVQENPFTEEEMRDMRYQDYLELKKEFENNIT